MSDTLAMYDVICKRSLMFIKRCLYAESDVVRFIAQYGVLYGGMASGIGMFLLIANIIGYQLAIYWAITAQPAKLRNCVKAWYQ